MGWLSPNHPLSASSNAAESRTVPEPDLAMTTTGQTRPMVRGGALRFPETIRDLSLCSHTTVDKWILIDCGPDGVRPRRVRDLLALSGQELATRH